MFEKQGRVYIIDRDTGEEVKLHDYSFFDRYGTLCGVREKVEEIITQKTITISISKKDGDIFQNLDKPTE